MIDLNDLRVFERVASLRSFSGASRALDLPKSRVSRSVQRLEAALSARLIRRTTRDVALTEPGLVLLDRCKDLFSELDQTIDYVSSFGEMPRGSLRISAGIGFGMKVVADLLPRFLLLHPLVDVALDLSSQPADFVGDKIDVAIRMGPMADSRLIAKQLGVVHRYICASPHYLSQRGTPERFEDLRGHDLVELAVAEGRKLVWTFSRGEEIIEHSQPARIVVNCALTIHQMLMNGVGIGLSSGYLCAPEFETGRLVRLFADWELPSVPVHVVFPTRRQLSPTVRAFVAFMIEHCRGGWDWQRDPIAQAHR